MYTITAPITRDVDPDGVPELVCTEYSTFIVIGRSKEKFLYIEDVAQGVKYSASYKGRRGSALGYAAPSKITLKYHNILNASVYKFGGPIQARHARY